MAQIKTFRGISYAQDRVNLDDVTTPPYDVISPAQQNEYYQRSPYSFIRLDLGKTLPEDNESTNRYTRSAADFSAWMENGVLKQDTEQAIYIYRQTFRMKNKTSVVTGIICLVKLEEFGQGVLPHEKTLAGPKRDRRHLMDTCRANFSQIFSLYADQSGTVKEVLKSETAGPPSQRTTDEEGVVHEIWPLYASDKHQLISTAVAPQDIFIADGHHRYETALNFSKDAHAAGGATGSEDYVMMHLVDMAHEDLCILPTHRVVKAQGFDLNSLLSQLGPNFQTEETDDVTKLTKQPETNPSMVTFGFYAQNRHLLVSADRNNLLKAIKNSGSTQAGKLDTTLLQEAILRPLLGIQSGDDNLSFTQQAAQAVSSVKRGESDLAVILHPTKIDQVIAVAEAGEKMPQKSTYFYPKPRTGLIINKFD